MPDKVLLGLDVGGSSIKSALVDVEQGHTVTPLQVTPTPQPSTPEAVLKLCAQIDRQVAATGPVGLAFPSVVQHGIARTAANVDHAWIGCAGSEQLSKLIGRPVIFLNDADAAGVAEITVGAGRGVAGVVLLLTFGTGIGSALFLDGKLVPNTELGHLELHGKDAELRASARIRAEKELSWGKWADRVQDYLALVEKLLSPELILIGGGVAKHADKFVPLLKLRAEIAGAQLMNEAGIVGAAMAAAPDTASQ